MNSSSQKKLIGLIIKNAREAKALTQEELSAKIAINQGNLSNIENGKSFPSFQTLCSIIEVLNIEPNELLSFLKFSSNQKDALTLEILEYVKPLSCGIKDSLLNLLKNIKH